MKIAFICVGNSARSQIAEALARHHAKRLGLEGINFYSAGSKPSGYVHPLALEVLEEKGIDTSNLRSKHLNEIPLRELDLVFVLCEEEECPYIPDAKVVSWALPDPAKVEGDYQTRKGAFEETFKRIEEKVLTLLGELKNKHSA
ncbi:MAG TPA: arsenate reductase ArsC [Aquificales bacterium]|nr:arsenate reductase ArsC [Aquificales bacterium]